VVAADLEHSVQDPKVYVHIVQQQRILAIQQLGGLNHRQIFAIHVHLVASRRVKIKLYVAFANLELSAQDTRVTA
jgi:hypothetical protein